MAVTEIELEILVDNPRMERIIERGFARLRRLSRKKRKAEWKHIHNQIRECLTVGGRCR